MRVETRMESAFSDAQACGPHHFFDELHQFAELRVGTISLVSLFVLGVALLVAVSFILVAASSGSMAAVVAVAAEAVSLVPIMILYVRRFGHL